MDPMESMSGGAVPSDFNAEDAGNMEDVRALPLPSLTFPGSFANSGVLA